MSFRLWVCHFEFTFLIILNSASADSAPTKTVMSMPRAIRLSFTVADIRNFYYYLLLLLCITTIITNNIVAAAVAVVVVVVVQTYKDFYSSNLIR